MLAKRGCALIFTAIPVLMLTLTGDVSTAGATHGSTLGVVDFVSVDVDPSASPANTPTSLGTRENCITVALGATFTVDVSVDEVDPADGISGFSAPLGYNPEVLNLISTDPQQMLSPATELSWQSPGTDGLHRVFLQKMSSTPATGSGVLLRLAFQAVGTGGSGISFSAWDLSVLTGEWTDIVPVTTQNAAVGVDLPDACGDDDGDGMPNAGDGCPVAESSDNDGDGITDSCDMDDDNDGYTDVAESALPLCGNGRNDDGIIYAASDDDVVDDGCPGGPAQAGDYSEGQFNIGTAPLRLCGNASSSPSWEWPSNLAAGGVPDSYNRITIMDLTSFLTPVRRLDKDPGHADFNSRWDLVPGPGLLGHWINISDLTALVAGPTGYPPMFGGVKAFNGPQCPGP